MMKTINIFLILAIALSIFACANLDDPQPINSIPTQDAIVNETTAKAAMNGVYSKMQDGDLAFDGWLSMAQYFSDEADFTGTFPTRLEFGNLNVFPSNTTMATVFSDFYVVINRANNIIALVPDVDDESFSMEARNDYIAQARLIRAQVYLHLVNLWQEVPLILTPTTEVGEVLNVEKSSVTAIYSQIEEDLLFAKTNLLEEVGPFTASIQAANALLARMYLYQAKYPEAYDYAVDALNGVDLSTVPYLEDQIYSLNFTSTDGNSIPFYYGPASLGSRHSIEPSTKLINAYGAADSIRFAKSIDTVSAGTPFGIKYPSFSAGNSGSSTDPIFFIRHAEMALIAAEAAAEEMDFTNANKYFNQVRTRAGLSALTLDASNYVDLILRERFVELAMEGPHRLIDLRRRGRAITELGSIGYEACDKLWPLPQRDIDRNPNLNQSTECCNC